MPRANNDVERINFYAPRKVLKVFRTLAKRRNTTYSQLVRDAMREYAVREVKIEKEAKNAK